MESTIFVKFRDNFLAQIRKPKFPLRILVLTFIFSRIIYYFAGIRYQADTYLLGWQFIDPYLLKNELWESIFYLHSQPPLLNLITGLGLQLFPEHYAILFHVLFLILGLILTLSLYYLGLELGFPSWLAMVVSLWFMISPTTVIYENWYFYTYPLTACLSLSALFFIRFIRKHQPVDALLFSILLSLIALTWGLFHLFWYIVCLGIAAILFRGKKRFIIWLLPGLMLVTMWYTKNSVLYDSFAASSWGGMNLFKIVTNGIPEDTRKDWTRNDLVSDLVVKAPFRDQSMYLRYFPDTPKTGISLLDQDSYSTGFPNYHSLVHVEASKQHFSDAIRIVRLVPAHYALNIIKSFYIFYHSASDYEHVFWIKYPINELDTLWNLIFYGQLRNGESFSEMAASFRLSHVAWFIVISFVLAVAGSVTFIWNRRANVTDPVVTSVVFMLWNILFVTAAGTMLDIGENNRFRFVIDPYILLLFVFVLRGFFLRKESNFPTRAESQ